MIKSYRPDFRIGDKLYVQQEHNCSDGEVINIIITVLPNGSIKEYYSIKCDTKTVIADVISLSKTKEELVEKIIKVQVNNLLPKPVRVIKKFIASIVSIATDLTYNDDDNTIHIFNNLTRKGYVVDDDTIQLYRFDRVEYIKDRDGIEVRFYVGTKYYNYAYETIAEAITVLRDEYTDKMNNCKKVINS